jgi:hypothetical protein
MKISNRAAWRCVCVAVACLSLVGLEACGAFYLVQDTEVESLTFDRVKLWVTKGKRRDGLTLQVAPSTAMPVFIDWDRSSLEVGGVNSPVTVRPSHAPGLSMVARRSTFFIRPLESTTMHKGREVLATPMQARKGMRCTLTMAVCRGELVDGVTPDTCRLGGDGWFTERISAEIVMGKPKRGGNDQAQNQDKEEAVGESEDSGDDR